MLKTTKRLLLALTLTLTPTLTLIPITSSAKELHLSSQTVIIMDELSKMYRASMGYIFEHQQLINQSGGDKSILFGDKFIDNVKKTYKARFDQDFPEINHPLKKMLAQVMVEVMSDNRTLITDGDIKYKGFIPAIFAFQLSEKLSSKGLNVKIKFTNTKDMIRNKLNEPDEWESYAIQITQRLNLGIYFDDKTTFDDKPAFRHFVPIKISQFCLTCHGTAKDNPANQGKPEHQWSTIDITGFPMEGWELDQFGGGVSVTVFKNDF